LLEEYEATTNKSVSSSYDAQALERLIFNEFIVTAMAQVQELVSSFIAFSDDSIQLSALDTSEVLHFFYATGLLVGLAMRAGAPIHLQLPLIFYSLIGSIVDVKKAANFHSKSTNLINDNSIKMLSTCALTMRLGLSTVFPEAALSLFDGTDISNILRSSSSILSAYYLRTHAKYDGVSPTDKHIEIFWHSLKRLSKKKLLTFLKRVWKDQHLPEFVYYENYSGNDELPAPLVIKAPTALGNLTPDEADLVVITSGNVSSISLPRCTNIKYMNEKLLTFLLNDK